MKKVNKTEKFVYLIIVSLIIVICLPLFYKDQGKQLINRIFTFKEKNINLLSFNDLQLLSKTGKPTGKLYKKLQEQLTTPYTVNKSNTFSINSFDKPFLRLAHWNIERGLNINAIKQIFSNHSSFYYNYRNNLLEKSQESFKKELRDIARSDIISLNEVDAGMPRTGYKNIASELADILGYNYAYATEFIELGPIYYQSPIEPDKYLGLHGNAILSRYPIISARIIRLPQYYDWYNAEICRKSPLEMARRYGAKSVFNQNILSEVRHGSRCALVADIQLPNKEIITVVSTHLEDRCYPSKRFNQVQYLFENLKYLKRPLVIAGDFNTSTTDSAPTSFKKEIAKRIKDPHFIARQLAFAAIPGAPIAGSFAAVGLSKLFQYKDPSLPSIPVFFPNQERKLFSFIKEFKFADGEGFDMKGDSDKSSNGKSGLLANSNERQLKGFESTFKFQEPRVIAYYKLDWFFVKPRKNRFEPFNGQTLQLVNHSYPGRISDHEPIIVDLTLSRTFGRIALKD